MLLAGRGALPTASVYARADELGLTRPTLEGVDVEQYHNDPSIARHSNRNTASAPRTVNTLERVTSRSDVTGRPPGAT